MANGEAILPYKGMQIIITENRDKGCRIVNGQDATLVHSHGKTVVVEFPDKERVFIHPVTHAMDGEGDLTTYAFMPAYARTICKSQGQNLKHLLLWLDCPTVPAGLAYVALSRVHRNTDLSAHGHQSNDACGLSKLKSSPIS